MNNAPRPFVNLASLPRVEALRLARAAGATIFADREAMQASFLQLRFEWIGRNCPDAVGQSDDEFNELTEALADEFAEGFDQAFPETDHAAQPADTSSGVAAAVALLQSWRHRGEEGVSAGQMAAELIANFYGRTGSEREAFSDTLMAFLMLAIEGTPPRLDGAWRPERDIRDWDRACARRRPAAAKPRRRAGASQ